MQLTNDLNKGSSSENFHKGGQGTTNTANLGPPDESASPGTTYTLGNNTCKTAASKTKTKESSKPESAQTIYGDIRSEYSFRTVEALNQFSKFTKYTPTDSLDLRVEFDLPRFKNLTD